MSGIDVTSSTARRRFYLERSLRKKTYGSGSDLQRLFEVVPKGERVVIPTNLRGLDVRLVGAHAASAYAPPRQTKDVDILVEHGSYPEVEARLRDTGWKKSVDLAFVGSRLGLYGSAWNRVGGDEIDVRVSTQTWASEAFAAEPSFDRSANRVIGLPYLVLMKLDSARGIDQADLTRILGRISLDDVERVVTIVNVLYEDSQAAEDVRQYAAIGRWEYESGS